VATPLLATLSQRLIECGGQSYLVGGYIRDAFLGRATEDVDIAVAADALEVAREVAAELGGRYVMLDPENRVARVVLPGDGSRWHLDFSTLQGNIEQDLSRRDFTINAMAVKLDEMDLGGLLDPFGGRQDLEQKLIRATHEEVFHQDAVRLLRAVRLAAELGFEIEPQTETLIQSCSHLVTTVAGERVREELCRLLALPQAAHWLSRLDQLGLLTAIIPELAPTKGVGQPKEHTWDVFQHSLETVAAIESMLRDGGESLSPFPILFELMPYFDQEVAAGSQRKGLLKLAGLLHDIAKPMTKSIDEGGRMRFLGHAQEGAAKARPVLERLRFSKREVELVEGIIRYHLRPGQMGDRDLPSRRAIFRYFRDAGEAGIDTLILSLADHLATRGPYLDREQFRQHAETMEYVLVERRKEEIPPPKLISGHDLMNIFVLSPGPQIGQLLQAIQEAQAVGEITTREEALSLVQRELAR
jgi:poly(A) polymerase